VVVSSDLRDITSVFVTSIADAFFAEFDVQTMLIMYSVYLTVSA